jgi:hypothetical protein
MFKNIVAVSVWSFTSIVLPSGKLIFSPVNSSIVCTGLAINSFLKASSCQAFVIMFCNNSCVF